MKIFITGTDTGVGKTYISVGLLRACQQLGLSTLGIKPVASGCSVRHGILHNEDADALQAASTVTLPIRQLNPFAFLPPIAPHLAAQQTKAILTIKRLTELLQPAWNTPVDIAIVEGAGGWYVPLNEQETLADFVLQQQLPVILVTGIRLGCINHSLLTVKALLQDGASVLGWIANCTDSTTDCQDDIIQTLKTRLPIRYLGKVKTGEAPEHALEIRTWLPTIFNDSRIAR